MKENLKKILIRALCGGIVGLAIGFTAYLISSIIGGSVTLEPKAVLINYLASLFIGIWCSAISTVFIIEKWSLLRQTFTHAVLLSPYLPLAFYLEWIPPVKGAAIISVLVYIVIYIIIWFSFKIYWTKKAKELNEELEHIAK